MAQIADGYVLADVQAEVAAAGCEHECACDCRRPYNFAIHKAFDVVKYRITVIAGLAKAGVGIGAEQHGIWTVDADQTQLAYRFGDGVRVGAHVGWKRRHWIAGPFPDAADSAGDIAFEYGAIFRKGYPLRGVLRGLPSNR